MIRVWNKLYVGSDYDYQNLSNKDDWYIIHACKEPYHRRMLGYRTPGCDPKHSEYLYGEHGNELILNLVDARDKNYIPKEIIDKAISVIDRELPNRKVLVHCNKGESRSAGIALYYLHKKGFYTDTPYDEAKMMFKVCNYPNINLSKGIDDWLRDNW